MRKNLLFVIILLTCLRANAQSECDTLVSLAKMNYEGVKELPQEAFYAEEGTNATIGMVDDGIAITNPRMQKQSWQTQVKVAADGKYNLEEGHDYIVRLTLKVPSNGTYQVKMGNMCANFVCNTPVEAGDDFQIIDVEYPEYIRNVEDACVSIGLGWVVGTTIIKEVEVFERLGYWTSMGFVELTPDESIVYKFILAMDDKSEETIKDLYAGMNEAGDLSIIKCTKTGGGGWYVRKDYPLPEGNYFESALYNSSSKAHANELYVILPQVHSTINRLGRIEDILEYLGDRVKVDLIKEQGTEEYKITVFRLISNLKTSEEWLALCLDVYNYGFDGLHHFAPSGFFIDRTYNSHLISVLSDTNEDKNLVFSMNWEGVEYPASCKDPDDPWKTTDEGLAIVNTKKQEYVSKVWSIISADGFNMRENRDYMVRLTMKVPSDGTYVVTLFDTMTSCAKEVPVHGSDDFQVIDILFTDLANYQMIGGQADHNAMIFLNSGWVVGATVLKKVQVFEKQKNGETAINPVKTTKPNDAIYNLSGQKVSSSYKGIVIRNGKLFVN